MRARDRRIVTGLALGLLCVGALGVSIEAQPPGDGPRMGGGRGGPVAGLRGLDLTDDQRQGIRSVMEQHRADGQALRDQLRAARTALEAAVTADVVNESEIRALAARLAEVEADAAVQRAYQRSEVMAILTPDQRAEMEERRERRRERFTERVEERRERRRNR